MATKKTKQTTIEKSTNIILGLATKANNLALNTTEKAFNTSFKMAEKSLDITSNIIKKGLDVTAIQQDLAFDVLFWAKKKIVKK